MVVIKQHFLSIMVMYAIAVHVYWVVVLVIDPASIGETSIYAIARHVGSRPWATELIIAAAAALAMIGLSARVSWVAFLLLPQQVLLMMSMAGGIEAIWLGQFADGSVLPRASIAVAQGYAILAAVFHTIAIIAHAVRIVR
jgi:hypothetical protein